MGKVADRRGPWSRGTTSGARSKLPGPGCPGRACAGPARASPRGACARAARGLLWFGRPPARDAGPPSPFPPLPSGDAGGPELRDVLRHQKFCAALSSPAPVSVFDFQKPVQGPRDVTGPLL